MACYGDSSVHYKIREHIIGGSEVSNAVTMKYAVFWDVSPRGSCKNADDGSDTFPRNVGSHKSQTASHPRKWNSLHNKKVICFL
jgi:hypothetical protein